MAKGLKCDLVIVKVLYCYLPTLKSWVTVIVKRPYCYPPVLKPWIAVALEGIRCYLPVLKSWITSNSKGTVSIRTRLEVVDSSDSEGAVVGRSCRSVTGIVAHQLGHRVIPHLCTHREIITQRQAMLPSNLKWYTCLECTSHFLVHRERVTIATKKGEASIHPS